MKYYAGLDVSLEETSVCVVDGDGAIVAERKVASEPRAIAEALRALGLVFERVGLEAGPLSPWLHDRLHRMVLEAVRGDLLCGRLTLLTPSCADHRIEHEKKQGPSGH